MPLCECFRLLSFVGSVRLCEALWVSVGAFLVGEEIGTLRASLAFFLIEQVNILKGA
jgi:hypothetical protein